MGSAWYRRKEHGPLGYTYPISWKGRVHSIATVAVFVGPVAYAMKTGISDSHPFVVWVGTFLLFLAMAAIGWAKTEYVQV